MCEYVLINESTHIVFVTVINVNIFCDTMQCKDIAAVHVSQASIILELTTVS